MAILVSSVFNLPPVATGAAFSVSPRDVLGADGQDWRGLQARLVSALTRLSEVHGRDGVAWVCAVLAPEGAETEGSRLGVVFAEPGEFAEAHVATLQAALHRFDAGWQSEGVRNIPRRAFPTLALKEGIPYHLWVDSRRGVAEPRLVIEDDDLLQTRVAAADADPLDVLPRAQHAIAVEAPRAEDATDPLEAYKVAFAVSVCERILEADGYFADAEVEFLRRTFPSSRLERLGLHDRTRFLLLRQEAAAELAGALTIDEKLALMGLFWRAGASDGLVEGAEEQVLRDAAAQLHLDWDEVEAYLHDLW